MSGHSGSTVRGRRNFTSNCYISTTAQLHRPNHPHIHITRTAIITFRQFLRPKTMVIIALLLCWNLRNSIAVAIYHSGNGADINNNNNYALSYFRHVSHQPHQLQQRQLPPHLPHPHHNHHLTLSNSVRLRTPPSFSQLSSSEPVSMFDLGGAAITLSDETALVGPLLRSTSPRSSLSLPFGETLAQSGTGTEMELSEPRRKKDCSQPSVATRGLLGPNLKRSYFAFTQDEVDEKVKNDEYRSASERRKRDIQHQMLTSSLQSVGQGQTQKQTSKRNGAAGGGAAGTGGATDVVESALPWTCETKYEWKDMGADHYPRFVRTAECKSRLCFNGFFRCRPRRYKTKVLKKIVPSDTTSCEDDDVSLPETLRTNWKFITVTINLCCDCTGRIPGNAEV